MYLSSISFSSNDIRLLVYLLAFPSFHPVIVSFIFVCVSAVYFFPVSMHWMRLIQMKSLRDLIQLRLI